MIDLYLFFKIYLLVKCSWVVYLTSKEQQIRLYTIDVPIGHIKQQQQNTIHCTRTLTQYSYTSLIHQTINRTQHTYVDHCECVWDCSGRFCSVRRLYLKSKMHQSTTMNTHISREYLCIGIVRGAPSSESNGRHTHAPSRHCCAVK